MSQEARRAPRRNVQEPVPVIDTMTEETLGRVGNVSETGMLLISDAALQEDALYQLRFHIRDDHGRPYGEPIDVGAQLLWCAQANTPGQTWAGLRFLTISQEHRLQLRTWVASGATGERNTA